MRELSSEEYAKRRDRKPKIMIAFGFVAVVVITAIITIASSNL